MEPQDPDTERPSGPAEERPDLLREARRPRRRTGGRVGAALTFGTVVVVVALLTIAWSGRVLFAPPSLIALAVLVLPYLFVAAAVWTFVLWSLVPDRPEPPLLLVAVVVAAAVLWGPSWPARGEGAAGTPVEMMTWNVRRLWGGPADGGDPLGCVVDAIEAEAPDVLTLLEVSRENVDELEKRLGLSCVHTTYLESESRTKGGLAACTRGDRWRLVGGSGLRYVDHRDWYYVSSEVAHDGRVFNVLAVHLNPYGVSVKRLREELARGETERLTEVTREGRQVVKAQSDQSAALLERVRRFQDPTIVAGDFNSTRDAALHASLRETLVDTWERGAAGLGATVHFLDVLPLRIDYIYASDAFAVVDAEVPGAGCSDHHPVVSRLVLKPTDSSGQAGSAGR